MTFLIYKTVGDHGQLKLRLTDDGFNLPNLLQRAWHLKDKPTECGWEVSADELIGIHSGDRESYRTRRLLSDFDPSSKKRIGLIELMHIYAFTWGGAGVPDWTPFMVQGRDVFYKDDYENLTESDRKKVLDEIPEYDPKGSDFAEFLYLTVNKNGTWVWGPTGMTNAAFLHGKALHFFQQALLKVPYERSA